MKKSLKGELYEIQGILYLILAQLIQISWLFWLVTIYGIITILWGLVLQSLGKKESSQ